MYPPVNRIHSAHSAKSRSLQFFAWFSVALVLLAATYHPVSGHDGWVHLNWLEQFTALFRSGELYPRWMPKSFAGYGSPAFYFYPPLAYWFASLVSFITPDPSALYYLVSLAASALSAATMHKYLSVIGITGKASVIGSLLYGFGLYRIVDIFVRDAFGEQFAFIFLPMVCTAIEYASSDVLGDKKRGFVFFCIGWTGLLLTSMPMSVVAGVMGLVYVVWKHVYFRRIHLLPLVLGLAVGICTSAIYWLPMSALRHEVHLERLWNLQSAVVGGGMPLQTLADHDLLDIRIAKLAMVFISILLLAPLHRAARSHQHRSPAMILLLLLCTGLFFQIPFLSAFIHKHIFPFTILQLYMRWNIVLTFALAGSIAYFAHKRYFAVLSRLCVAILSFASVAAVYLSLNYHSQERPNPLHFDVGEYLPIQAPFHDSTLLRTWITEKNNEWKKPYRNTFTFTASALSPHRISLPHYYWSAWKATDEMGREITLSSDTFGRLTVTLPASSVALKLFFIHDETEYWGGLISCAGMIFFIIILRIYRTRTTTDRSLLTRP